MSDISISVIIPVYNAESYLAEAIESVLNQDYPIAELLIIDDGSTDGSADVAKGFGSLVKYFYKDNSGIGSTINYGISKAQEDYLAFSDADDIWAPGKLSRQVAVMTENSDLEVVFGHMKQFISPELSESERQRFKVPEQPIKGYSKGAMLIRKHVFDRVQYTSKPSADFVEWYGRAQEANVQEYMLSEVVYLRRIHLNNSVHTSRPQDRFPRLLKEMLDRRRQLET